MDSLAKLGIELTLFQINKRGMIGYLLHLRPLIKFIKKNKPDVIHAHYGLSGLLANFQRRIPVVTTFHGSDINDYKIYKFSFYAHKLSAASIFVGEKMHLKMPSKKYDSVIPCAVDTKLFYPIFNIDKNTFLVFQQNCINILFTSSFKNTIKNYPLAKDACLCLERKTGKKVNLIEFSNFDRLQANLLLNSIECVLLTSFSEGSPQVIKEAMACNKPIVATNVGDIECLFGNTEGCYLTSFDPEDVAEKIELAIEFGKNKGSTKGRERIIELGLDSSTVAKKIIEVYKTVLV